MSTSLFSLKYALAAPPAPPPFNTAIVAGIAVVGAAILAIFIFSIFYCLRRRRPIQLATQSPSTPTSGSTLKKRLLSGPTSIRPLTYPTRASSGDPAEMSSPSTLRNCDTMLPEQPPTLRFPMPPGWQPGRPASQPGSPRELMGDMMMHEHQSGEVAETEKTQRSKEGGEKVSMM